MLSEQAWVEIIIGIGRYVVGYCYQFVVKCMDDRKTRIASVRCPIDKDRLGSHTRLKREPYDERNS